MIEHSLIRHLLLKSIRTKLIKRMYVTYVNTIFVSMYLFQACNVYDIFYNTVFVVNFCTLRFLLK